MLPLFIDGDADSGGDDISKIGLLVLSSTPREVITNNYTVRGTAGVK